MTQDQGRTRTIADRYAVRTLIGRGGSGAVWRGEDLVLGRPVAIKQIVVSDTSSTRSRLRALREAQAVAGLDVAGVVRVYDVLEEAGQVCLIMELVDAPSLARVVRRRGTFAPDRAARVGLSMLRTLRAVHAAGIVHRDIKPSNVLVGDCGVRITDFGIALLADDAAVTAAGSVLGTPAYMAPEQARGERAGPAADLYGLAATLYFAVEGRAPFDDVGPAETTRAVREQPHRPGRHLGALDPIITALLCKDPRGRADVTSVEAALEAVAEGGVAPPAAEPARSPTAPATGPVPAAQETGGADADGHPTTALDDARDDHVADAAARGMSAASPREPPAGARRRRTVGPPGERDDHGQLRRTVLWVVGLLALLAVALLLLFLAIREHPEAPATVAAALLLRPMMGGPSA